VTTETNLQRHGREMAESQARLRAEQLKDPMYAAMSKAMEPTKAERDELEGAEGAVTMAEQAVAAAFDAIRRAERGIDRGPQGFEFFTRSKQAHRAAAIKAALPALQVDLGEAQAILQAAIRRRNEVASRVERTRMDRRLEAKLSHSPKRVPPQRRAVTGRSIIVGRKDAA
jgi:hypothetical protein